MAPNVISSASIRRLLYGALGISAFIGLWHLISIPLSPIRLPSPLAVFEVVVPILFHMGALAGQFGPRAQGVGWHLLISLGRLLAGVGIGIVGGMGIGLLMSYSRRINDFLDLPTRMLRAVPPLALIPFVLIWFGTGSTGQIALITFYIFLIVLANTLNAVSNVAPVYTNFSRSMGATRMRTYRDVYLPAILPELLGPLRIAIAFAWGLLVVAELVGAQYGIGRVLSLLIPLLQTSQLIAAILWIVVLAIVLDFIVSKLYKRFLVPWRPE